MPYGEFDFLDGEDDYDFSKPKKMAQGLGLLDGYGETTRENLDYVDSYGGGGQGRGDAISSVVSDGPEDNYARFLKILEEPSASEGIVSDYISRQPRFDQYNPSRQDKLTAAVMGGIAGMNHGGEAGIKVGQEWRNKPFYNQVSDYEREGKFVDDAAKLADAQQNRKIKSAEFSMRYDETKRAAQAREDNNRRMRDEAERAAREREKDRDEDRKARADHYREVEQARREANDLRNDNLALRREMFDWRKSKGSDGLDGGFKPKMPSGATRDDKLKENFMRGTDPRYGQVFSWPNDSVGNPKVGSTPLPKWAIEGRVPTAQESALYDQLLSEMSGDMRLDQVEEGRLYGGGRRIR